VLTLAQPTLRYPRAAAPTLARLDVYANTFSTRARTKLDLPTLPNLCALHLRSLKRSCDEITLFTAYQAPRLHWLFLERFLGLRYVTIDCPELAWLGISGMREPACVHVFSRCACPLMGKGEAELAPDGVVRQCPVLPGG